MLSLRNVAAMRRAFILFSILALVMSSTSVHADSKVIKVLPHFVDSKNREALSPSLYERDAYQGYLREHPTQRTGMRFHVQWKSDLAKSPTLKVRLELRGTKGKSVHTKILEQEAEKNGWITSWTVLPLEGERYKAFGELIAWRATFWDGSKQLAEQTSFLW